MSNNIFTLTDREMRDVRLLARELEQEYSSFDDLIFLKDLPVFACRLPQRLIKFLNDFKHDPPKEGYCIVANLPLNIEKLGPTPSHWQLETNNDTCMDLVMSMCLCSAVIGDIFGWLTQQDGRMVHDVLPIRDLEGEQLGCGSIEPLLWHTEDAFHETRGDYLMLACLRNEQAIPTMIGKPDYKRLSDRQIDKLFEKHFTIKPDNSHKVEHESDFRSSIRKTCLFDKITKAYKEMERRAKNPEKISVLFGSKNNPYLRIDPYFMSEPEDPEAKEALDALINIIDEDITYVALKQRSFLILDNYQVVHGRPGFRASYNGADRWLKRINIQRDIRKCCNVLETNMSRVVY